MAVVISTEQLRSVIATHLPLRAGVAGTFYAILLVIYLAATLFLYQFGLVFGAGAAFRIPDFFAFACIALGAAVIAYRLRLTHTFRSLLPIAPLVSFEVLLPLIGTVAMGRGLDNSVRMLFLWAPMLLYVAALAPTPSPPSLHKNIRRVIVASLIANLIYSIVQMLSKSGFLPQSMVILAHLQPIAIDDSFRPIIQGMRAQGFFINSTGLSVFGTCCLAYFLGSHYDTKRRNDMLMAMLSILLVLLSMSRTGLIAVASILVAYLFLTDTRLAMRFVAQFGLLLIIALVVIDRYIGLELLLSRIEVFLALGAAGALEDYSFMARFYGTWPNTLAQLREYPFGTLVSASSELGLIDSGYLTLYAQGKWPFIAAFALVIAHTTWVGIRRHTRSGPSISLFLTGVFLTLGMVMANPIRNSFVVFMLTYLSWQAFERAIMQPRRLFGDSDNPSS